MTCLVSHIMEQKIAGCINGWRSPCAGKCRHHSLCDKHAAATSTTFCLQTSLHFINNTKNISRFHASVQRKKKQKKKPCMPAGRQCGWQAVCVVSQLLSASRWVGAERMVFSLSCCCLHRVTRSSPLIKLPFFLPFARSTCISPISSGGDSVLHLLASTSKDAPF